MSFWNKKLKDARPLRLLRLINPNELVRAGDQAIVRACENAAAKGFTAGLLLPTICVCTGMGIACEYYLTQGKHNKAKYH